MNNWVDIKIFNAVQCRICNAAADLMFCGMYICQDNPCHWGDTWVGIFTDMTYPEETHALD